MVGLFWQEPHYEPEVQAKVATIYMIDINKTLLYVYSIDKKSY